MIDAALGARGPSEMQRTAAGGRQTRYVGVRELHRSSRYNIVQPRQKVKRKIVRLIYFFYRNSQTPQNADDLPRYATQEIRVARKQPVKPAKAAGKHPGGRPTKYKPEYDEQAYKLCLLSATDAQMADFFGVDEATINRWKVSHPGFCESLKKGKMQADAEIAEALFHRAKGYSHDAVKIITVSDGNNQGSHVEQVPYVEHYPPDTAAAFIWLKNRAGWKDRQDHTIDAGEALQQVLGWVVGRNGGHSDNAAEEQG